jgi:hypothetical protein
VKTTLRFPSFCPTELQTWVNVCYDGTPRVRPAHR